MMDFGVAGLRSTGATLALPAQSWPSRLYLVGREGKVAFSTRLGELEFRPADLDAAIREILSKTGVE